MKIAILPTHKSYKNITIAADLIALRWRSQICCVLPENTELIILDQLTDKDEGERLNYQAVNDCINYEKAIHDAVMYKGISIVDVDIRQLWAKVFCQIYRETYAILTVIKEKNISCAMIETGDPWAFLYEEIFPQVGIRVEQVISFGKEDSYASSMLKSQFRPAFTIDMHQINKRSIKHRAYSFVVNFLSSIVRLIKGRRPSVIFSIYKPLEPIKEELLFARDYYSIIYQMGQVNALKMIANGTRIFMFDYDIKKHKVILNVITKYRNQIGEALEKIDAGIIKCRGIEVNVLGPIKSMLQGISDVPFYQIANNIDLLEDLFNRINIRAYFGFCDSPWEERLIIRICQKRNIKNAIMINGYLAEGYSMEAKIANHIFTYGKSMVENYLRGMPPDRARAIGNPLYEAAYKMRSRKSISHPPMKILVGTHCPIIGDINCPYSCSEIFLDGVLSAIENAGKKRGVKYEITLKLHPGESKGFYEWYLARKGIKGITIIDVGNLQDLLQGYDLLVISHSVAIFEASLMGLPVIFFHPTNQVLYEPYNGYKNLISAFNVKELEEALNRVTNDKEYALSFTQLKILSRFTGPVDGSAKDNILAIVKEMSI